MGDQNDDSQVNVSDQTVSEPISVPAQPDAPQVTSLDDDAAAPSVPTGDAPSQQGDASGGSGDSDVSVSDETVHADYQPPAQPEQPTIGPANSSGSTDDRPDEQHSEQGDDADKQIEQDSSSEADSDAPAADGAP